MFLVILHPLLAPVETKSRGMRGRNAMLKRVSLKLQKYVVCIVESQ